jgi:hypothetical protein
MSNYIPPARPCKRYMAAPEKTLVKDVLQAPSFFLLDAVCLA